MKNVIHGLALLSLCSTSVAWAENVVRIPDGDCTPLSAAASSPAGHEPSLIVLARNGYYKDCTLDVVGNINIDGAGASLSATLVRQDSGMLGQIIIAKGASLTIHQLNIGGGAGDTAKLSNGSTPSFIPDFEPVFAISGSLVLDSVSIFGNVLSQGTGTIGGGLFFNAGDLNLRNVTITKNEMQNEGFPLLDGGNVMISGSTIVGNQGLVFGDANVTVGNSIIAGNSESCSAKLVSLGGNVTDDATCGLGSKNDHTVADARLLELDTHGGVVKNVALRNDSPAIGNGLLSNCEATDSRGFSRGKNACDSGAYEFGGGNGQISSTGMSGFFYNPANDGHYVTIQRLHDDTALVIWNTFDENGVPAWLYGVGAVSGQSIHVGQVGRNSGGKLLPGGDVVGSHAALWGTIDVSLSDCYNAKLNYNSTDPNFGSGSTSLTRLAFLDGVNCAP